jgi:hypothetical protein
MSKIRYTINITFKLELEFQSPYHFKKYQISIFTLVTITIVLCQIFSVHSLL